MLHAALVAALFLLLLCVLRILMAVLILCYHDLALLALRLCHLRLCQCSPQCSILYSQLVHQCSTFLPSTIRLIGRSKCGIQQLGTRLERFHMSMMALVLGYRTGDWDALVTSLSECPLSLTVLFRTLAITERAR